MPFNLDDFIEEGVTLVAQFCILRSHSLVSFSSLIKGFFSPSGRVVFQKLYTEDSCNFFFIAH